MASNSPKVRRGRSPSSAPAMTLHRPKTRPLPYLICPPALLIHQSSCSPRYHRHCLALISLYAALEQSILQDTQIPYLIPQCPPTLHLQDTKLAQVLHSINNTCSQSPYILRPTQISSRIIHLHLQEGSNNLNMTPSSHTRQAIPAPTLSSISRAPRIYRVRGMGNI